MKKSISTAHCPECSGRFTAEETCADRYHACLALEYTDPAYYGPVHHLTVLSYKLQHPSQLSADGWQAMRGLLDRFLSADISPVRMRQLLQQQLKNKSFNMVKGAPTAQPDWNWTKTIMDVRLGNATTYCADVRAWAKAVHCDLQQKDA
jgi:hypothetical protein